MNTTSLNQTNTSVSGIKRNQKQEMSSEEETMQKEISSVETSSLNKVFNLLCSQSELSSSQFDNSFQSKDGNQNQRTKDFFTSKDVTKILNDLGYMASKQEVEQMIWEVNDSLNGRINRYEFNLMYMRCKHDDSGLEPRNLYNVVQFLMYLQNNSDQDERQNKTTITVEDTLELLYVRYGRQQLDEEIDEIFGEQKKTQDGQEKQLTIAEYLTTIKKKDFKYRENKQIERTTVKQPLEEQK